MRIVGYDGEDFLQDINSMMIMIKTVPFEGTFAPAFMLVTPSDDYEMDLDEINALMDGVEIAQKKIDEIVDYIIKHKIFKRLAQEDDESGDDEEEGQDDLGTSN